MTLRLKNQLLAMMIRARANALRSIASWREALVTVEARGDVSERGKADAELGGCVDAIVHSHERIEKIDAALARVTEGTYGYCLTCSEAIAESRLRALPWAERCRSCEEHLESAPSKVIPRRPIIHRLMQRHLA